MAYIAHSESDRQEMLKALGVESFDALIESVPAEARLKKPLNLPPALSEMEAVTHLQALADQNRRGLLFVGGGAYDHYIPAAVRHILLRPEFYTAYTPYQAEVSQGTLQAIFEYQSLICELTGMEVANASMYDGGSALAEAALMALHHTGRDQILVAGNLNPFYRQILQTYLNDQPVELIEIPLQDGAVDQAALQALLSERTAAVLVQNPNFYGIVEDLDGLAEPIHQAGGLLVVSVDPISLSLLKPPGAYGADIVVGEGQALGNPLNFGGPYLGLFASRRALIRRMPGRIVGVTEDGQGRRGFVTVLQTREQQIRREKATSNICTNSQLCALAATVYLSLLGREGFREVGRQCLQKSHYLAGQIEKIPGFKRRFNRPFFKEFAVSTPVPAAQIVRDLQEENIYPGLDLEKLGMGEGLLIAVTEKRSRQEMDRLVAALKTYQA